MLGVAAAGCSKARASDSQLERAGSSPAEASPRQPTAPMAQNPRDITALFQNEAANRPVGGLSVERVRGALRAAGVELKEARQHLARPYGARYCLGARAGDGLALSICEYADADAAAAGAATSRKIPLAHREISVNQATSLTIRKLEPSAANDALARRLFRAFANL